MTRSTDTLDQLKADLVDQAEALLLELFGKPTRKTSREWRWGRKGSVSYRFRSAKSTFRSFEADQGGSLLDAIMFRDGCSFPQAVKWAREWLGAEEKQSAEIKRPRPQSTFDADAERQTALAEALALWRAGRSTHGTAAARYLQGRAITEWPADAVRLVAARDVTRITGWKWWRWPALMFPMTDDAGTVTAVQLIALNDDGSAVKHWDHGGKLKIVRGVATGSAVRLPSDSEGPLVLAEGGEDALSIRLATGQTTWAMLGAIGRAPLDAVPLSRAIVVARDDDPPHSPSRKALRKRIAKWRAKGRHVVEAQPWQLSRADKSDFNDVLQQDGPDAVRKRIDAALTPQTTPQGKPRADALLQLSTAIGRTTADLIGWQADGGTAPPSKVIRTTTGLGKSEATLQATVDAIAAGHRVVYAAPTHELAAELAARAKAIAAKRGRTIGVRVWHGRAADDPDVDDEKMCLDLEAVELARAARVNVSEVVCGNCQHRAGCSYIAQTQAVADLWLVPHALLFTALPDAMEGAALLVIDEGIALAGIGAQSLVRFNDLDKAVMRGRRPGAKKGKKGPSLAELSGDLTAELLPLHRKLLDADHAASSEGTPLQREALVSAGIDADMAEKARRLNNQRIRGIGKMDAPTRDDLVQALKQITIDNRAASQAASLWRNVRDFLLDADAVAAGRVDLVEIEDGTRAFRNYGLDKLGDGWGKLPTLHLDATADMGLLRYRFPHVELVADIVAAEPFVSVRQVVGRAFGKKALECGSAADDARRFGMALASEQGGKWLMVASKAATDGWARIVPPHVGLAHWGGLRGLDQFKDADGVVCIGRWGVPPAAVERMASVLTGRAVPRIDGWFPTATVTLRAADGSTRTVDADQHPDATADAIRKALVDAELLQAIGRGRGVQRTAGNPLTVWVLGNVPLPLPLASVSDWEPVDTYRAMLADHGACLGSAGDAAAVLGTTRKAVELQRARIPSCPYKEIFTYGHEGILPGLAAATYQRAGAGRSEQRIVFDRLRIPDARAWLEARLGALVHFDGADLPPPDQPPVGPRPTARKPAPAPAMVPMGEARPPIVADQAAPDAISDQYARPREDLTDASRADFAAVRARDEVRPIRSGPWFMVAPLANPLLLPREFLEPTVSEGDLTKPDIGGDLSEHPYWSTGGIMPPDLTALVRARQRTGGISQERLAQLMGLSRPQLANVLQGRFGLSPAAAGRLRDALILLPRRAPDLFDLAPQQEAWL